MGEAGDDVQLKGKASRLFLKMMTKKGTEHQLEYLYSHTRADLDRHGFTSPVWRLV